MAYAKNDRCFLALLHGGVDEVDGPGEFSEDEGRFCALPGFAPGLYDICHILTTKKGIHLENKYRAQKHWSLPDRKHQNQAKVYSVFC